MSDTKIVSTKKNTILPAPAMTDVFDMLCIKAGESGRDRSLFGGCLTRAGELFRPFIAGISFPHIFLECPLSGDPYLDLTVLYGRLTEGTVVKSKYCEGCDELFRRYIRMKQDHPEVVFGFELDTSKEDPGMAAVHFDPRGKNFLVTPFCEAIGEDRYGELYLQTAEKLADTLPPSFFGMFRGREEAPLRVCGYLGKKEMNQITGGRDLLLSAFEAAGFSAYDDRMMDEIVNVFKIAPCETDYQLDIYPDGKAGDVFSIDLRLAERAAASVRESFASGAASEIMSYFTELGIADERTGMLSGMATSFAFPSLDETGEAAQYAMVLHPMWLKIRWKGARLCSAKCYSLMRAGFIRSTLP